MDSDAPKAYVKKVFILLFLTRLYNSNQDALS
jgi:hypothetical protein